MIELSETLADLYFEISFKKGFNKNNIISESEPYIQYVSLMSADQISLYENNEWYQDVELNVESALDCITANLLDSSTEDTEFSLRVEIDKPSRGSLHFYS
ncbi:hypothetical protein JQC92_05975 [Shewanella sp. 202IG2-18]|uniref:hypothetical protein n=1 Tax=Parashewanella hymeniacidonis TaxID=2807618 RepID=UPI00196044D5|nr:hypothetical protein [Parashewanella hymeniacidonis]MBM7071588.1 hypothetical protein [Parashewanella hymeniacidonis]